MRSAHVQARSVSRDSRLGKGGPYRSAAASPPPTIDKTTEKRCSFHFGIPTVTFDRHLSSQIIRVILVVSQLGIPSNKHNQHIVDPLWEESIENLGAYHNFRETDIPTSATSYSNVLITPSKCLPNHQPDSPFLIVASLSGEPSQFPWIAIGRQRTFLRKQISL